MFHFPWYCYKIGLQDLLGCPIRKPPDQSSSPTPRGISLVSASFIASLCQGIHRVPLLTYHRLLPQTAPPCCALLHTLESPPVATRSLSMKIYTFIYEDLHPHLRSIAASRRRLSSSHSSFRRLSSARRYASPCLDYGP